MPQSTFFDTWGLNNQPNPKMSDWCHCSLCRSLGIHFSLSNVPVHRLVKYLYSPKILISMNVKFALCVSCLRQQVKYTNKRSKSQVVTVETFVSGLKETLWISDLSIQIRQDSLIWFEGWEVWTTSSSLKCFSERWLQTAWGGCCYHIHSHPFPHWQHCFQGSWPSSLSLFPQRE